MAQSRPTDRPPSRTSDARERILESAYELFSRHGTRGVGIDAVIEHSGVAKMTLYRHFGSKDHLVLEFLRRREERWTQEWLQAGVERRAEDPGQRLLAVFDLFHEWFQRDDFEGCSFINVLLETEDAESPAHAASIEHLANIRAFLREVAEAAGVRDPDDFSRRWHILMKGSIVAAGEGDRDAARRARAMGELLLADERAPASVHVPAV